MVDVTNLKHCSVKALSLAEVFYKLTSIFLLIADCVLPDAPITTS